MRTSILACLVVSSVSLAQYDPYERQQEDLRLQRADENFAIQQQQRVEYANDALALRKLGVQGALASARLRASQQRGSPARAPRRYSAVWAENVPRGLLASLFQHLRAGEPVTSLSLGRGDAWVVTFGRNGWAANGVPPQLMAALRAANGLGHELRSAALGPNGEWAFVEGANGSRAGGLDFESAARLERQSHTGERLRRIAFVGGHLVTLSGANGYACDDVPSGLCGVLHERNRARAQLADLSGDLGTAWVLLHDGALAHWHGVPEGLVRRLNENARRGARNQLVALSAAGGWVLLGDVVDPRDPAVVR